MHRTDAFLNSMHRSDADFLTLRSDRFAIGFPCSEILACVCWDNFHGFDARSTVGGCQMEYLLFLCCRCVHFDVTSHNVTSHDVMSYCCYCDDLLEKCAADPDALDQILSWCQFLRGSLWQCLGGSRSPLVQYHDLESDLLSGFC